MRRFRHTSKSKASSRSLADLDAYMRQRFPGLPPDPRTPDEIAEAQAKADLAEAARWGYIPGDPETLSLAILALEAAAATRRDPMADRPDTAAMHRAQDRGDLARRLAAIKGAASGVLEPDSVR